MNDTTFLIRGGIVLPLEGRKVSHDPGSVLVVDGTIAAVGSVEDVAAHPAAASAPVVEAANHAVMPGMHNGHLHSGLLRGTAESLALFDWLENYVDPAHRALTPEIARAASYMAYTECLRGGTTGVDPYGIEPSDDELRFTDCVVWQPDPGPAAAGGGPVRYRYSVSHPYGATLTKVPSGDDGGGAGGFTILIVASPVTEATCVVWRSTVVHDAGADLDAQRAFNDLIFSQDIDVVESQRPRRLPVDPRMESHQGADAGSLAYRRWLRARSIRYGTVGADDPDSGQRPEAERTGRDSRAKPAER